MEFTNRKKCDEANNKEGRLEKWRSKLENVEIQLKKNKTENTFSILL